MRHAFACKQFKRKGAKNTLYIYIRISKKNYGDRSRADEEVNIPILFRKVAND